MSRTTEMRRCGSRASMSERCTSTKGAPEQLERVADRPLVVGPGARVDDGAVHRARPARARAPGRRPRGWSGSSRRHAPLGAPRRAPGPPARAGSACRSARTAGGRACSGWARGAARPAGDQPRSSSIAASTRSRGGLTPRRTSPGAASRTMFSAPAVGLLVAAHRLEDRRRSRPRASSRVGRPWRASTARGPLAHGRVEARRSCSDRRSAASRPSEMASPWR